MGKIAVLVELLNCIDAYSVGKMKSHKCKLIFMSLQTDLAIGSTNLFIGIMNPVHYTIYQFDLNFEPISLHVVNNFMIWDPIFKNQFCELYNIISLH